MDTSRAAAGFRPVVVGNIGHRCREVKRLPKALGSPYRYEVPIGAADSGQSSDSRPRDQAPKDHSLSREAIADCASKRTCCSVDPRECCTNRSELCLGEVKFCLKHREDAEYCEAVGVVEKTNAPEEEDRNPWVEVTFCGAS